MGSQTRAADVGVDTYCRVCFGWWCGVGQLAGVPTYIINHHNYPLPYPSHPHPRPLHSPLAFACHAGLHSHKPHSQCGACRRLSRPKLLDQHQKLQIVSVIRFLTWNMILHREHHLYPMVPFYNLPRVREELEKVAEKLRREESSDNIAKAHCIMRSTKPDGFWQTNQRLYGEWIDKQARGEPVKLKEWVRLGFGWWSIQL